MLYHFCYICIYVGILLVTVFATCVVLHAIITATITSAYTVLQPVTIQLYISNINNFCVTMYNNNSNINNSLSNLLLVRDMHY